MKYRIVKRPKDEMYYIQTLDEQKWRAKWQDYDGSLGEPNFDYPAIFNYYRTGFFSLKAAKNALKRIKDQAERDNAPDEVVWEEG